MTIPVTVVLLCTPHVVPLPLPRSAEAGSEPLKGGLEALNTVYARKD